MTSKKLGVLVSGGGTNLQSIIDQIHFGSCNADISCVISNVKDVYALKRAETAKIPNFVIDHKQYELRLDFEQALLKQLEQNNVDILILAGFMRVLSESFTANFIGKSLNIHPSLLPALPGLHTHQRALNAQMEKHGCSVHFVSGELDGGPIILQASVPILSTDDAHSLAARVLEKEHIIYPRCIQWLCSEKIYLKNNRVYFQDTPLEKPLQLEQL